MTDNSIRKMITHTIGYPASAMGAVMGDISESHTVDAGPPKSN